MKKEEIKTLMQISILNQTLIYLLDEIESAPFYVRQQKQKYNNFKKVIERDVNMILAAGDYSEKQYWQQCAEKFYTDVKKIKIEIEVKE